MRRRLLLAEELLRVSSVTGRRVDALLGLVWRTVDLFLAADPRAERSLSELRTVLAEHDHGAVRFVASAVEVMLDVRAGRFEAAEAGAAAGAEFGRAVGDADAVGWHGVQILAVRWYRGRAHELVPMLAAMVAAPALGVVEVGFFAALAVVAAAAGDRRVAAGALARLRGRRLADLPRSSGWLVAMYGAAEAADLLQDREVAGEVYELLAPFAERPMMASLAVACFGSTHQALGVASLTVGESARAVGHFQAAVRANQAWGTGPAALSRTRRPGAASAASRRPAAGRPHSRPPPRSGGWCCRTEPPRPRPGGDDGPGFSPCCGGTAALARRQLARRATLGHDCVGRYRPCTAANPSQEICRHWAQGADRLRRSTATAPPHQPVLDAAAMQLPATDPGPEADRRRRRDGDPGAARSEPSPTGSPPEGARGPAWRVDPARSATMVSEPASRSARPSAGRWSASPPPIRSSADT
jgi:hypothetical protein